MTKPPTLTPEERDAVAKQELALAATYGLIEQGRYEAAAKKARESMTFLASVRGKIGADDPDADRAARIEACYRRLLERASAGAAFEQLKASVNLRGIVWRENRSGRLASVNGKRIREGDPIDGGIVKEIQPDRLIVLLRGYSFAISIE